MKYTVDIKYDDRQIQRLISHVIRHLTDANELMSGIGAAMKSSTIAKFRGETDGEASWERLKSSTSKGRRKGKKKREHKILQDTGKLRNSIEYSVTGKNTVSIGTDIYYGVFHQTGTKDIPARPFMNITSKDETKMMNLVERYLVQVF